MPYYATFIYIGITVSLTVILRDQVPVVNPTLFTVISTVSVSVVVVPEVEDKDIFAPILVIDQVKVDSPELVIYIFLEVSSVSNVKVIGVMFITAAPIVKATDIVASPPLLATDIEPVYAPATPLLSYVTVIVSISVSDSPDVGESVIQDVSVETVQVNALYEAASESELLIVNVE